jgi:hypothetical protein
MEFSEGGRLQRWKRVEYVWFDLKTAGKRGHTGINVITNYQWQNHRLPTVMASEPPQPLLKNQTKGTSC